MADFLSTLFGGGAEQDAANANAAALTQYGTTGTGLLNTGLNQSTGAVNTGATNAANILGGNTGVYNNLGTSGANTLNTGLTNQIGALNNASGAYAPLSSFASSLAPGTQMYINSLGLNGPQGNAAATNAFQTGPGYDFQMKQGIDAIDRSRANSGMLGSGNTNIDAMTYGQGLANQAYGGWQSNLQGLINPQLSALTSAAGGQATVDTNMANAYSEQRRGEYGAAGHGGAGTGRDQHQRGQQAGSTSATRCRGCIRAMRPTRLRCKAALRLAPWRTTTWWLRGRPRAPRTCWGWVRPRWGRLRAVRSGRRSAAG